MSWTVENYNLNIGRQIQRLLSVFEKPELFNIFWLRSLLNPAQVLHTDFLAFTLQEREEAYANSQTLLLVDRLNSHYDPVLRRITIDNNKLNNPAPVTNHFTVNVPASLPGGEDADTIQRFVQKYVLVDRIFNVVVF